MIPIEIASGLLGGLLAFRLLGGIVARVGGLLLISCWRRQPCKRRGAPNLGESRRRWP
jgi:hypothetical protein